MRIVEVVDNVSGTVTRIGLIPQYATDCVEAVKQVIREEELYEDFAVHLYDGDLPNCRSEEELERVHELSRLLSLKMGWA